MKYAVLSFLLLFLLSSCTIEPNDSNNDVECLSENFVGEWMYQSTGETVLSTVDDITIELAEEDNVFDYDLKINGSYFHVNRVNGCSAGEVNGGIDVTYELISMDELLMKNRILVGFGSTHRFTRK